MFQKKLKLRNEIRRLSLVYGFSFFLEISLTDLIFLAEGNLPKALNLRDFCKYILTVQVLRRQDNFGMCS